MKVGIVEVCEANHYTAVLALAKTYLVNSSNKVSIYTTGSIAPLLKSVSTQCDIVVKPDEASLKAFLSEISLQQFDRIHINTISRSYRDFAAVDWKGSIYFTVHNIDLWFDNPVLNRLKVLQEDIKRSILCKSFAPIKQTLILFLKDFRRQAERDSFIRRLLNTNYKILVYSDSQKQHLQKYVSIDRIITFPFCLHEKYEDTSDGRLLRIAIPGSVSNLRRDYVAVLDLLENSLKDIKHGLIIDLLGYISDDSKFLIKRIQGLISNGFQIIYNESFIDTSEFDKRLSSADLILGNLKVQLNAFRKYGETKETGVTFNIIKCGKPGLLPVGYTVDNELAPACIKFSSYEELGEQVKSLYRDRNLLLTLKQNARKAVKKYSPEELYKQLIR